MTKSYSQAGGWRARVVGRRTGVGEGEGIERECRGNRLVEEEEDGEKEESEGEGCEEWKRVAEGGSPKDGRGRGHEATKGGGGTKGNVSS